MNALRCYHMSRSNLSSETKMNPLHDFIFSMFLVINVSTVLTQFVRRGTDGDELYAGQVPCLNCEALLDASKAGTCEKKCRCRKQGSLLPISNEEHGLVCSQVSRMGISLTYGCSFNLLAKESALIPTLGHASDRTVGLIGDKDLGFISHCAVQSQSSLYWTQHGWLPLFTEGRTVSDFTFRYYRGKAFLQWHGQASAYNGMLIKLGLKCSETAASCLMLKVEGKQKVAVADNRLAPSKKSGDILKRARREIDTSTTQSPTSPTFTTSQATTTIPATTTAPSTTTSKTTFVSTTAASTTSRQTTVKMTQTISSPMVMSPTDLGFNNFTKPNPTVKKEDSNNKVLLYLALVCGAAFVLVVIPVGGIVINSMLKHRKLKRKSDSKKTLNNNPSDGEIYVIAREKETRSRASTFTNGADDNHSQLSSIPSSRRGSLDPAAASDLRRQSVTSLRVPDMRRGSVDSRQGVLPNGRRQSMPINEFRLGSQNDVRTPNLTDLRRQSLSNLMNARPSTPEFRRSVSADPRSLRLNAALARESMAGIQEINEREHEHQEGQVVKDEPRSRRNSQVFIRPAASVGDIPNASYEKLPKRRTRPPSRLLDTAEVMNAIGNNKYLTPDTPRRGSLSDSNLPSSVISSSLPEKDYEHEGDDVFTTVDQNATKFFIS